METTAVEMMPLALELWKSDKAEYWLDRIHAAQDNSECVFFQVQPGSPTQGRCAIYPFRPLICRLFGFFTIVNKYGKHVYGSCRVIKLRYPEVYEKALLKLGEIGRASVCTDYSIRIIGIDSMLGDRMLGINLAASIALEKIGYRLEKTGFGRPAFTAERPVGSKPLQACIVDSGIGHAVISKPVQAGEANG